MDIINVFSQFASLKVMVVGDVMVDRYLTGRVGRISPEAPVPVVEWSGEENRLGGAANVALNVQALGATPFLCGVIGQDADSACFLELMERNGLSDRAILGIPNRPATVKTRVIADSQHLLRLDKETTADLSEPEADRLKAGMDDLLSAQDIQVIIIQDYNKGVLTENVISYMMATARRLGIPVAVDPKFKNFWAYQGADLFKPNLKEVRDALPFPVTAELSSLQQAGRMIREKLQNRYTLITLSEKGAFMDDGTESFTLPTRKRKVADVCGAGDAVISVASLALAIGLGPRKIAELANLTGGQVVEKVGVEAVDPEQIKREMQSIVFSASGC